MEDPTFYKGVVKFYNNKARFGFIRRHDTGEELYVRKSGLLEDVQEGDEVEFQVEPHEKGPKAISVRKVANDH